MNQMATINLLGVKKRFGETTVIHDVNMTFHGGKIYGLIGRNGSGKTVLMKIICGLMPADDGEIIVNGQKISKGTSIPKGIGAIIEAPGFLSHYSGYKNLRLLAGINSVIDKTDIKKVLERVDLNPKLRKRVGAYSLGMRQRLGLAQAIMENPPILILDEPMNGLDTSGIETVRKLLLELRDQGKLIIMASHMWEDINCLCDEVFRIQDGRMVK